MTLRENIPNKVWDRLFHDEYLHCDVWIQRKTIPPHCMGRATDGFLIDEKCIYCPKFTRLDENAKPIKKRKPNESIKTW